jgi:hypothetical protein
MAGVGASGLPPWRRAPVMQCDVFRVPRAAAPMGVGLERRRAMEYATIFRSRFALINARERDVE